MPSKPRTAAAPEKSTSTERWVATLGAASALLGALVGGLASYLVADRAADRSADQAELSVRRDIYAQYYGDIAEYVSAVGSSGIKAQENKQGDQINESVLRGIREDLQPYVDAMFRNQAQVVLVAPLDVEQAAFELSIGVSRTQTALTSSTLRVEDIDPVLEDLAADLNAFADAASEDLESSG